MQKLVGTSASDGRAIGPAVFLKRNRVSVGRSVGTPVQEQRVYEKAKAAACKELEELEKKAPEQDKTIFTVQRIMIDDDGLCHEIAAYINAGAGAAASVERAANIYAQRLRAIGDDYMSERACDVLDACQRIVNILDGGKNAIPMLETPSIIISDEIYPTDIMSQPTHNLLGFVTSKGSPNAHASIIARSMGIPAVVQTGASVENDENGVTVAVDGTTGEVYFEPDSDVIEHFEQLRNQQKMHQHELELMQSAPCMTKDGTVINLYAACITPDDIRYAVKHNASGISMLLSEYLFEARHFETEDEQYKFYKECMEAANGVPVNITTYDVSIPFSKEDTDVHTHLRGIRYCLEHPTFFRTQLTALLRASVHGKIRVVFPFVTDIIHLKKALKYVEEAKDILRARGESFDEEMQFGVRIDTPASALLIKDFSPYVSFTTFAVRSITQHTYAIDVNDENDMRYLPSDNGLAPAARQLIEYTMLAAENANIPYSVGGEWAVHEKVAAACVRLGIYTITVPSAALLSAKENLSQLNLNQ